MMPWREMNQKLKVWSEEEIKRQIEEERTNGRRLSVLLRLHQRYTSLRTARERIELLGDANAP